MKRFLNIVGIVLGVGLTLGMTVYAFANASKAGQMVGIVANDRTAVVQVMDQPGASGSITVASVKVPGPSWIAVHLDEAGMPGPRVGLVHVAAGVNRNVKVPLQSGAKLTGTLIVAVHADRGIVGKFEFAKATFDASPDKPYFVDGMELAMKVKVAAPPYGVVAGAGEATLTVADQPGATASIVVAKVVSPTAAFVVVHTDDNGKPGTRLGFTAVPAGTSTNVVVKLDPSVPLTGSVLVALHADRGVAGTFEFNMMDKYNSPDQPFFVGGQEVATAARIR